VEGIYVISAEFMFQYGDKKFSGTFVHLEKYIPHLFRNVDNDTGKVLTTIVPAGFEISLLILKYQYLMILFLHL